MCASSASPNASEEAAGSPTQEQAETTLHNWRAELANVQGRDAVGEVPSFAAWVALLAEDCKQQKSFSVAVEIDHCPVVITGTSVALHWIMSYEVDTSSPASQTQPQSCETAVDSALRTGVTAGAQG